MMKLKNESYVIEEDYMVQEEICCKNYKFRKRYDYGREIYYCDHEGRSDDLGKHYVEVRAYVV